jgi:Transglycosylase-like domain
VRAAGLVLTLVATAAGAAGAATLKPATDSRPDAHAPEVQTIAAVAPAPTPTPDDHVQAELDAQAIDARRKVEVQRAAVAEAAQVAQEARDEARRVRREKMWDELAECETGGDWNNPGDFGGGLGIYVGTWRMYGGRQFAARPQWASKAQQIIIAERIARDGFGGWGCAHELGWVN